MAETLPFLKDNIPRFDGEQRGGPAEPPLPPSGGPHPDTPAPVGLVVKNWPHASER